MDQAHSVILLTLGDLAHSRSGDKGNSVNIAVIALTPENYPFLVRWLTNERVKNFFHSLGVTQVDRYELPNLFSLNFILHNALDGGGSRSLRYDSQGKALGQAILSMKIDTLDGVIT